MYYYGYAFDFERHAVSIRAGGLAQRKQEFEGYFMVIEDPFVAGISIA